MMEQLELVREEMKNGHIGQEVINHLEKLLREYEPSRSDEPKAYREREEEEQT